MRLTPAQARVLDDLAWAPDRTGVWWHDLAHGARDVLLRLGLIAEVRAVACSTKGCTHPGYVTLTDAGVRAWRDADKKG